MVVLVPLRFLNLNKLNQSKYQDMITYKISRSVLALSICLMLVTFVHTTSKAQLQQNAQWAFHIAFEDATGAKDTVWILADTANTWYSTISGLYGEVPITPDSINFQVWFYHPAENSYPYETWNRYNTFVFPIENNYPMNSNIEAANYELPIIARWDSSLFAADVLYEYGDRVNWAVFDNEYFFGYHSDDGFNLLLDDHAIMPGMPDFWWGSRNHFPLWVNIQRGPYPPLAVDKINDSEFSIYPNPTNSEILISFSKVTNADLRIYNANGMLVKTDEVVGDQKRIDLRGMAAGLYFVEIKDGDRSYVKKVVVNK